MVMDTMPPNEGTMAGDGKPVIERTYKRLAAYHGAAANVAKRAEAAAAAAAGGAAGGGGTAAPLVVGKGGLGARRVVGATLDARAPRFVQLDDMHPVERAYASWAVLEDDDAFTVGGMAACALGGVVGSCFGCLGMGGPVACGALGGADGACGAMGGATCEVMCGMAAACGMALQQGGVAADGAQAQSDMVADGAQAQGGVRITYFKVNTD